MSKTCCEGTCHRTVLRAALSILAFGDIDRLVLQVLGEDLVLVSGQQQRLQRGGDTWANPVSYDKLAVRYRRWRNGLIGAHGSSPPSSEAVRMSAGQLFQEEESDIEDN